VEQEEGEEDVLLVAADEEGRAPASCPTGGSSRTVCFPSITGTALDGFAAHDPPRTRLRGKEGGSINPPLPSCVLFLSAPDKSDSPQQRWAFSSVSHAGRPFWSTSRQASRTTCMPARARPRPSAGVEARQEGGAEEVEEGVSYHRVSWKCAARPSFSRRVGPAAVPATRATRRLVANRSTVQGILKLTCDSTHTHTHTRHRFCGGYIYIHTQKKHVHTHVDICTKCVHKKFEPLVFWF
jgi:hypothetical protein